MLLLLSLFLLLFRKYLTFTSMSISSKSVSVTTITEERPRYVETYLLTVVCVICLTFVDLWKANTSTVKNTSLENIKETLCLDFFDVIYKKWNLHLYYNTGFFFYQYSIRVS